MKWFQHKTDSYNDPDISDAEDIFGDAGYSVFFKILEIYGREYNSIVEGKLNISQTFLRRKLRKSWTKVQQILNFYQTKNRIYYETDGDNVSLYIPKFLEYSDNWTKRPKENKHQKLCSSSVVTTSIEKEEEKEKEKETNKRKFNQKEFDIFYLTYPVKAAKKETLIRWKKLIKSGELPELSKILEAIKNQKEWRENSNGEFRPEWKNPATWLNKGCWEDECGLVSSERKESWRDVLKEDGPHE